MYLTAADWLTGAILQKGKATDRVAFRMTVVETVKDAIGLGDSPGKCLQGDIELKNNSSS